MATKNLVITKLDDESMAGPLYQCLWENVGQSDEGDGLDLQQYEILSIQMIGTLHTTSGGQIDWEGRSGYPWKFTGRPPCIRFVR